MSRTIRANGSAIGLSLAASIAVGLAASLPATAVNAQNASSAAQAPDGITLSVGRGQLVRLPSPMTDLFVADDKVADVQVRSPTVLYVFGKGPGETTISATNKAGTVVYANTVRVGSNLSSVGQMLKLAMPEAAIAATPMNGLVLLTGTVASPNDIEEAQRLTQAFVGDGAQVVSRLKTATPLQVNLRVKIAEVSRDFIKQVGVNLLTRDTTGGFQFNVAQGRNFGSIGNAATAGLPQLDASSLFGLPAGSLSLPFDPRNGQFITQGATQFNFDKLLTQNKTALGLAGHLFGLDIASALDLAETDGLVTTLAEPNLTALSGETASFLAGGEIPIPVSEGLGSVSIEYKQYGISLSFTPTVLADGRISMRVRPEVSQLSNAGSVTLNGFTVPGLTTRRAETTIELGSGQAFMIGGLLSNTHNNSIDKAPGLGDLPVLGALFRSNSFRRSETELVIVVTPYLVKPVNAGDIKLPTDGYKAPTDVERLLLGQTFSGKTNGERPKPTAEQPQTAQPGIGPGAAVGALPGIAPAPAKQAPKHAKSARADTPGNAPDAGFSFN